MPTDNKNATSSPLSDSDGSRNMTVELDQFGKAHIKANEPTGYGSRSESIRLTLSESTELFKSLGVFLLENH